MPTSPSSSEQLAVFLGARPTLLLELMLLVGVGVTVAMVLVVRGSREFARGLWGRASRALRARAEHPLVQGMAQRFPTVTRGVRALSATRYLVVHLTLGLALSLASLLFVVLAEAVRGGETMVRVDQTLASSLHAAASPEGIALLRAFTRLGTGWWLAAGTVAVGAALFWRRRRVLASGWIGAMAGAGLLNQLLKMIFERPRPVFGDPIAISAGWSFPSGHSMGTLVFCGMLAYLSFFFVKPFASRLLLVVVAIAWTSTMGFSRLYLGAHYLSDVLAGFAAGTVWMAACISGIEVARRRPRWRDVA